MTISRRSVIQGGVIAGAAFAAPAIRRAAAAPADTKTMRAVMQGDLRVFDPIWTTANITAYHGAMVYDMLFAIDDKFQPQPQMVGKCGVVGRQADLHVRAARRAQMAGRHRGHVARLRRLASAAGR